MAEHSINLARICEAAGLPADVPLTASLVQSYIVPCITATFCDHEVAGQHPAESDPVLREHFGETRFAEGTFGERVRAMLESDDADLQRDVHGLLGATAFTLARLMHEGGAPVPPQMVAVNAETSGTELVFDGHRVALPHPLQVVVEYGPGLHGTHHIAQQLADLDAGKGSYAYFGICKGPFINNYLLEYWGLQIGDRSLLGAVIGRYYIGREDGIAAATNHLVDVQTERTGSPEIADLVLASGIHRATHDEVATGIANAHDLLKPGGVLLVRAPKAVNLEAEGSVAAETMVDMALGAGFDPDKAQFFDVVTGNALGQRALTLSAIFRR